MELQPGYNIPRHLRLIREIVRPRPLAELRIRTEPETLRSLAFEITQISENYQNTLAIGQVCSDMRDFSRLHGIDLVSNIHISARDNGREGSDRDGTNDRALT